MINVQQQYYCVYLPVPMPEILEGPLVTLRISSFSGFSGRSTLRSLLNPEDIKKTLRTLRTLRVGKLLRTGEPQRIYV